MKQSVNLFDFRDAFVKMDRTANFSSEALDLLFEYFEEYESDSGEEIDLDVIAICCEYTEDSWSTIADNYNIDLSSNKDDEVNKKEVITYLQRNTCYIGETDAGLVYQAF